MKTKIVLETPLPVVPYLDLSPQLHFLRYLMSVMAVTGDVLEIKAAQTALYMDPHTAPVVATIPDAILCCDSETLVRAKRLATRYDRSAPMTPMTTIRGEMRCG